MKQQPSSDFAQAAHDVVHAYGVAALAALLGMPVSTLYNKANPHDANAQFTAPEVVQITAITRDLRMIQAHCRGAGGSFYALPQLEHVADAALLEIVSRIAIKEGLMHLEISKAFEDGKLKQDEYERIHKEICNLHGVIAELDSRLAGMVRG